jgi:hypothetical protein
VAWARLAAHPAFTVREIEVVGNRRATAAEIVELAGLVPGDRWLDLDAAEIRSRMRAHPWVARARVGRPWIGRVRLAVEECVPVARIRLAGGVYGVCEDLRVVPGVENPALPLITEVGGGRSRGSLDPSALARGIDYVRALARESLAGNEPIELELASEGDLLRFPERGFDLRVTASVEPGAAVRNAAAFLEKLDARGASRGTLRLISEETAVWKAA